MITLYDQDNLVIKTFEHQHPKLSFSVSYQFRIFEASYIPLFVNHEMVNRWVIALKSGEYNQAAHFLHSSEHNTYCCLGVLAKVCGLSLNQYVYKAMLNHQWFMEHSFTVANDTFDPHYKDLQLFFSRLNDTKVPFDVIGTIVEQMATTFPN